MLRVNVLLTLMVYCLVLFTPHNLTNNVRSRLARNYSKHTDHPFLFQTIIQSDCILRGDLANVRIGRQCVISKRSVIRPPFKKFSKGSVLQ